MPVTSGKTRGAYSRDLTKTYGSGQAAVRALDNVNVAFERGRFTAVMGPSGSGKSTLMQCMAGLDRPTSGHTFIGGEGNGRPGHTGGTQVRPGPIGFVFPALHPVAPPAAPAD